MNEELRGEWKLVAGNKETGSEQCKERERERELNTDGKLGPSYIPLPPAPRDLE